MPFVIALVLIAVGVSACAQSAHQTGRDLLDDLVAPTLQQEIDESVAFADLKASPDAYVGRTVMLSGITLNAKRTKDRTEIEVLELPSQVGGLPTGDRTRSEGRFLAVQEGFLDPATVESGTPVTVVGEVRGSATRPLDESEYRYPVLAIKQLIDWNKSRTTNVAGAYPYAPYGTFLRPYPYLWGSPYGYYPYPYWGPYYPLLFGIPTPAPAAPPPSSIPPQFRKRG